MSVGGLAGCLNSGLEPTDSQENSGSGTIPDGGMNGSIRPTEDPETVPQEWRCTDSEFTRHPAYYENVKWGDTAEVSLRISDTAFEYGDTAQITLTNVTEGRAETGTEIHWGLEILTDDGWQEVRGKTGSESFNYSDIGTELPLGEGFEWRIELTEEGIIQETSEGTVCPDLVSGRYRFVYWGGIDPAVAVGFDLTREASGR